MGSFLFIPIGVFEGGVVLCSSFVRSFWASSVPAQLLLPVFFGDKRSSGSDSRCGSLS